MGKKQRGELTYLFISQARDILDLMFLKAKNSRARTPKQKTKEGKQKIAIRSTITLNLYTESPPLHFFRSLYVA